MKIILSRKIWFSLLMCITIPSTPEGQVEESVIKAVFIQRFADFTTWPSSSNMQDKTSPFVIGVFGRNNFSSLIEKTYFQKSIFNKKIKVKYIEDLSETAACHIIVIPKLSDRELENLLRFTEDKPILTISDTRGYAAKGVHINLFTVDQSVRFEINEAAVRKSGLHMSHLLLDFANIVSYQENN